MNNIYALGFEAKSGIPINLYLLDQYSPDKFAYFQWNLVEQTLKRQDNPFDGKKSLGGLSMYPISRKNNRNYLVTIVGRNIEGTNNKYTIIGATSVHA